MQLQWITKLIKALAEREHWGKLTINFEKGRIVHVDEHRGVKPPK